MAESKTFPIFKILAILCLAVVGVTQITVMSDNASEYDNLCKVFDAEYLSIIYYIIGFAFLVSAFFTLFSLGKRNSAVITASIEFLVIIGIGYYLKKYYKPDDIDRVTALALLIPVVYIEELELVTLFSVAALVLGILDLNIGSTFTIKSNVNECMYCGRYLRPGEKCTCDLDDTYVINDFDTDPENYADDVEKRKCVFCGRLLYGTETCNCPETKRREAAAEASRRGGFGIDTPTYTPPPPRDVTPPEYGSYGTPSAPAEPPRSGAFINKSFITKPTLSSEPPRSHTPEGKPADMPKAKKPGDERFFSKPSDL